METKPVVLHFTGSVGKERKLKQSKKKRKKRKKKEILKKKFRQTTDSCSS